MEEDTDIIEEELIFVLGIGSSGTSWMRALLNSHPQVVSRVEESTRDIIWSYRTALSKYNTTLKQLAQRQGQEEGLLYNMHDLHMLIRYFYIYSGSFIKRSQEGRRISRVAFIDKSMMEYFDLFANAFPRAKYIYMIRDPRDTAISSWRYHNETDHHFFEREGNIQFYARRFARKWSSAYVSVFYHGMVSGEASQIRIKLVRYEDLYLNYMETVGNILDFLGIDNTTSILSEVLDGGEFERLTGGRKKGEEELGNYLRCGVIGEWKEVLTEKSNEIINASVGRYMRMLGYDNELSERTPIETRPIPPKAKERLDRMANAGGAKARGGKADGGKRRQKPRRELTEKQSERVQRRRKRRREGSAQEDT